MDVILLFHFIRIAGGAINAGSLMQCCKIRGIIPTIELLRLRDYDYVIDHMIDVGIHIFKFNIFYIFCYV